MPEDAHALNVKKTEEAIRRVLAGTNKGFILVGYLENDNPKTQYGLFGSELSPAQIALGVIEGTYINLQAQVMQAPPAPPTS